MVVGTGVTEIADSEEEPLTSSPAAVSDAAVDKLSATARQDAQAVAYAHQETTGHIANETSGRTDCLDVDQKNPLTELDIENSGLQPVPRPKTNNISTYATKIKEKVDWTPSLASADAIEKQCRGIHENGKDYEGGTSADTSIVLKTGTATGLDERTHLPTNVQIRINEAHNNHHSAGLPNSSSVISVCSDAEHFGGLGERLQHEALRSYATTPEQLTQAFDNGHESCRAGLALGLPQNSTEPADGEALAEGFGHNTVHEASVNPHVSEAAGSSTLNVDISIATSRAGDVVDLVNQESLLAVINSATSSAADASQYEASSALPDLGVAENVELKQFSTSIAASAPPSGVESATATDEHSLDIGLVTQGLRAGDYEMPSEPKSKSLSQEATKGEKILVQVPTDLSTAHSAEAAIAEQVTGLVVQDPTMTIPSSHQHHTKIVDGQSSVQAAPGNQKQSKSTGSDANECVPSGQGSRLSPQEITLAELRAQKATLLASLRALPAIQVLIEENQTSAVSMPENDGEPTEADITAAANKIVKRHIKLLHQYNELKDVGQGLMGLIADQRGVRVMDVQDEFGIDAND